MSSMEPFHVRQQQEKERQREAQERKDAAMDYGYYDDEQGNLVHDTSGQNKVRSPDPHRWLSGRAEEPVEEEKDRRAEERVEKEEDSNKQSEARRLSALEYGYVDMNGHYVHLQDLQDHQDHGHPHRRKPLKALPRKQTPSSGSLSSKQLSSSTYMVCTQAGNSALVALPDFAARLDYLEKQVTRLQNQRIMDLGWNYKIVPP
jgi:hypothetical protein